MIQSIRKFLGLKQSAATRAMVAWMSPGQAVWTPVDYAHLAKEGYGQNVIVYRAVNYRAAATAGLRWVLKNKFQRSEREIERHPVLDLLARPNPYQSWATFCHSLISYRLLSGNVYIERVGPGKDGLGTPKELWTHRPDLMKVIVGDRLNPVAGYCFDENGQNVRFKREQILHWKTFNPLNHWYGMSPLEAMARSIDQNNESRAWNVAMLQNFSQPPGVLSTKEGLTDQQYDRLTALLKERSGRESTRPLLLEGGLEWTQTGLDPVDMAWLEGLKMSTREICTGLGVPPGLLGDVANKTYANFQEDRKSFYEESVIPDAYSLRDELNAWLLPLFGERLVLDIDLDSIEALQEDRGKKFAYLESATFLTPNEKRRETGFDDYKHDEAAEEADKLHVSTQIIPLESYSTFESVTPPDSVAAAEAEAAGKSKAVDQIIELRKADLIDKAQGQKLLGIESPALAAKTDGPHKYSCVMGAIAGDVGAEVLKLGQMVPTGDLAEDGRETWPHVTVLYGLHTSRATDVQSLIDQNNVGPMNATLGKVSLFETPDFDVIKIEVQSDGLYRLNELMRTLPFTNSHPVYIPHVTVAYVKPGAGKSYVGYAGLAGKVVTIDQLVFSSAEGTKTTVYLKPIQ